MTTYHVRQPVVRVTVDGAVVTNVLGARVSYGFDQQVSQATIRCTSKVPWAHKWSEVWVWLGVNSSYLATPRFRGYLLDQNTNAYPGEWTLVCYGKLVKAQINRNDAISGTDLSLGGNGQTDQNMVMSVLNACGGTVVYTPSIEGTGKVFGTTVRLTDDAGNPLQDPYGHPSDRRFTWEEKESGLSFIQRLDSICLGYRTFDLPQAGGIVRRQIFTIPPAQAAGTITDADILLEGGHYEDTAREVYNRVHITGMSNGSIQAGTITVAWQEEAYREALNPDLVKSDTGYNTWEMNSPMLELSEAGGTNVLGGTAGLDCGAVAAWQLGEHNRVPAKLVTPLLIDTQIYPAEVYKITSTRLDTDRTWQAQHVEIGVDQGKFDHVVTWVGGDASAIPVTPLPQAAFTLMVDQESVILAGTETPLYLVHCTDTSWSPTSSIVSREWSVTGGTGVTPTSGSGLYFNFTASSLTGCTVTLTITDAQGQTATFARDPAVEETIVTRRLYTAATDAFEALDGSSWRTYAVSGGTVVGNGPVWGAGTTLYYSADDLRTAPGTAYPFDGQNVTRIWIETDSDTPSYVLAGGEGGDVSFNSTGGTPPWTQVTGPTGDAVVNVVINRYSANEWTVLLAGGYYSTRDAGITWTLEFAAEGGETFTDHVQSHTRTWIAMEGGRALIAFEPGGAAVTQDFSGCDFVAGTIIAVAADIRLDRCYCYTPEGHTYYTATDGGTVMTQGADLPDGVEPQPRGLWRDGEIKDLLYFAAGTAGIYKSADGFGSADAFYRIRQQGVGSGGASSVWTMVGAGELAVQARNQGTVVLSAVGAEQVYDLGVGGALPDGWADVDFDDSGWDASVAQSHPYGNPCVGASWVTAVAGNLELNREFLARRTFTLSLGYVTAATLKINADDYLFAVMVNGVYLWGTPTALPGVDAGFDISLLGSDPGNHATVAVPPSLLRPGQSNVIAAYVNNALDASPMHLSYRLEIS